MRTTITLEPDVARKLQQEVAQHGSTLKAVVNDALRRGLRTAPTKKLPPFTVKAHPLGLRAGVDPNRLNQLADDLDIEEYARKRRKR